MSKYDELIGLLNREYELILNGRLSELEALIEPKQRLFEDVSSTIIRDARQIEKIRVLSQSNSELLHAAGKGIKTALTQISAAKNLGDQSVYGPAGQKTRLVNKADRLEQKV